MMSIKAILGKCFQLILPLRRDWTCLFSNYPMDKYLFKSQDEDTHTTPMEAVAIIDFEHVSGTWIDFFVYFD